MRQIKRIPVTKEGFENLKRQYVELKEERKGAVKTLSEARSMGDLSENGLYTAAKARLRSIDSRLFRLNIQIKLADVIEENKTGIVGINSKVVVSDGKSEKKLHIVGSYESNPLVGKISQNSPLGKTLIGKQVGERVEVITPSGKNIYKILKIS